MATCKYLLNSGAEERFAQPSTILAGTERAALRSCLAISNCSGGGKVRVARETSNASRYASRKSLRSLYVLIGTKISSHQSSLHSLLLYFVTSHLSSLQRRC